MGKRHCDAAPAGSRKKCAGTLKRCEAAALTWPPAEGVSEEALEEKL